MTEQHAVKQPKLALKDRFVPIDPVVQGEIKLAAEKAAWDAKHGKNAKVHQMKITGIDISFGNMVMFLVQLAIAAIPAAIIVGIVYFFFGIIFGGFIAGMK